MTDIAHGTLSGYAYRGCRCPDCKEAGKEYFSRRRKALQEGRIEAKRLKKQVHGELQCYKNGCRCPLCRTRWNAYVLEHRRMGQLRRAG